MPVLPGHALSIPGPEKEQANRVALFGGLERLSRCPGTATRWRTAMTTFNDREKGFESKFAHDEEMQFKASARRNRLLGLWAASLLGKTGADAEAYALEVVRADFIEAGHEDVFRKLAADLGDRADEATIRAKMAELLGVAKGQVIDELPPG